MVADEFLALQKELVYANSLLETSDRIALFFAIMMLFGLFLPWLSTTEDLTQIGLMGGGDIHLILAVLTIWQVREVAKCHIKAVRQKGFADLMPLRLQRIALNYLLIGMLSAISAIILLFYFGLQNDNASYIIDIRLGFYVTIFSGLAIFFCGWARFLKNIKNTIC